MRVSDTLGQQMQNQRMWANYIATALELPNTAARLKYQRPEVVFQILETQRLLTGPVRQLYKHITKRFQKLQRSRIWGRISESKREKLRYRFIDLSKCLESLDPRCISHLRAFKNQIDKYLAYKAPKPKPVEPICKNPSFEKLLERPGHLAGVVANWDYQ